MKNRCLMLGKWHHLPAAVMIMSLLLFIVLNTGCSQKETTRSDETSMSTSFSESSQSSQTTATATSLTSTTPTTQTTAESTQETGTSASSESTTSETTPEPTGETTAPSTGETTVPTANEIEINYQPLPATATHLFDLNSDGTDDSITYSIAGDFDFTLTVNGIPSYGEGEFFLKDWFFVIDLDEDDPYMDIAVQELGPSSDFQVSLYYFDGAKLVLRGKVQGLICDIFSETIESDPFGSGTVQVDGRGGVISMTRGMILHTWFFDEPWQIGSDGLLYKVPRNYYPMYRDDPVTGERIPEFEVIMLMDLELVASPNSNDVVATAMAGQTATLVQTDDVAWVQMRTQSGDLGWFYVEDYFNIPIGGTSYFASDVMDGLFFAD